MPITYKVGHMFDLNNTQSYLRKFIINVTMISFSSGLDSATIRVMATKALFDMICLPCLNRELFLFRNSRKIVAPILLQPSAKG